MRFRTHICTFVCKNLICSRSGLSHTKFCRKSKNDVSKTILSLLILLYYSKLRFSNSYWNFCHWTVYWSKRYIEWSRNNDSGEYTMNFAYGSMMRKLYLAIFATSMSSLLSTAQGEIKECFWIFKRSFSFHTYMEYVFGS